MALVGESGCGKSVSALSVMRLVSAPAGRIVGGEILFKGRDLLKLSEEEMRKVRGREIGMIFQEPMTSLNPVLTIGRQLTEPLEIHLGMTPTQARARAVEMLWRWSGIPDAERRAAAVPAPVQRRHAAADDDRHGAGLQSGAHPRRRAHHRARRDHPGPDPRADHGRCRGELGAAMLIITHNLGVVARYADRVNVMYAGRIVERATARELYANPRHPYTLGLLRSVPRLDEPRRAKLASHPGPAARSHAAAPGLPFAPRCTSRSERCRRGAARAARSVAADHTAGLLGAESNLAARVPA